ncbi:MAG: ParB N-terminal domain-containing protein [Ignavibacteria bacterium]
MNQLSGEKFQLVLINANKIKLHEECDDDRFKRLIQRFRNEKVLYNPLIVGKYKEDFILIDGANRFEALSRIGCKIILCQLVDYKSNKVDLKSWNHFVYGIRFDEVENFLKKNNFNFSKSNVNELTKSGRYSENLYRLTVLDKDGKSLMVSFNKKIKNVLYGIGLLIKYYAGKYSYDRINSDTNLSKIKEISSENGLLFLFPRFKKKHIVMISNFNDKLPAGITRHIIPNRVLHLKYEISLLKSDNDLKQRNKDLQKIVQQKIDSKKVRLYREPLLIFDE